MVLQGSAYLTEDVDLLYARDRENVDRIAEMLKDISARLRVEGVPEGLPFAAEGSTIRNGMNFTLMTSIGSVDLFGELPGLGKYDDVIDEADRLQLGEGLEIAVLTPGQLITAKRAAGRPKDLAALPELEAIAEMRARERDS
jgi:hypothetical protein